MSLVIPESEGSESSGSDDGLDVSSDESLDEHSGCWDLIPVSQVPDPKRLPRPRRPCTYIYGDPAYSRLASGSFFHWTEGHDFGFDSEYYVPPHGSILRQVHVRGFYWVYSIPMPLEVKRAPTVLQRCPEHRTAIREAMEQCMIRKRREMRDSFEKSLYHGWCDDLPSESVDLCDPTCPYRQWPQTIQSQKLLGYEELEADDEGNCVLQVYLPAGWEMWVHPDYNPVCFYGLRHNEMDDRCREIRYSCVLPPVPERQAPQSQPAGWIRRVASRGLIYWLHRRSGLYVLVHPCCHPLLDVNGSSNDAAWIRFEGTPGPLSRLSTARRCPLNDLTTEEMRTFKMDERMIVHPQLKWSAFFGMNPQPRPAPACGYISGQGHYYMLESGRIRRTSVENLGRPSSGLHTIRLSTRVQESQPCLIAMIREWASEVAAERSKRGCHNCRAPGRSYRGYWD